MGLITKASLSRITNYRNLNLSKGLGTTKVLSEAFNVNKVYDIFLSHSYMDKDDIASLKILLEDFGLSVYIDWIEDAELNRNKVTKKTAETIKFRMKSCKSLVYAFSENSNLSKWMPWELGYFDGIKGRVTILPISNNVSNTFNGVEYLGIYPYVTRAKMISSGKETLWINESQNKYVVMSTWLTGSDPTLRT